MAAGGDLKLLGLDASPFDNRVRIALNLKGLQYEVFEEDLLNKSELLLASNPVHKNVPVLIHGDKPIPESLLIVEYIDEVWSGEPRILPSDPYERSVARFWAAYLDNQWIPIVTKLRTDRKKEVAAKKELTDKIKEGFVVLEEAFLKCGKGKAFFGGDAIGLVDIAFGSFWNWILAIEILADAKLVDQTTTPNLCTWAPRFFSHEAVKDVLLEPPKLVEGYNSLITRRWHNRKNNG